MSVSKILTLLGVAGVMTAAGSFVGVKEESKEEKLAKEEKEFKKFNIHELEYIRSLPKKERKKAVDFLRAERNREWEMKMKK